MSTLKKYYTWAEIREKVRRDTDTQEETFVTPKEMLSYCNEAIDTYESHVNTCTGDAIDYFLDVEVVDLVTDQEEYSLPDSIYAHKIRNIMYQNQDEIYEIKPARSKKFQKKAYADQYHMTDLYQYYIQNTSVGDPQVVILPKPRVTGPWMKIWYLRNLNRMSGDDTDICDIPVCINFIFQYMKVRVYEKEGHPNLPFSVQALEAERAVLNDILADAQPDTNNEIEMDLSYYQDFN